MVMSIDNMILALVIFVLEIVEFAYFKNKAIEDGEMIYNGGSGKLFLKVNKDTQIVKSGFPDGNNNDEFDPSYLNNQSALSR